MKLGFFAFWVDIFEGWAVHQIIVNRIIHGFCWFMQKIDANFIACLFFFRANDPLLNVGLEHSFVTRATRRNYWLCRSKCNTVPPHTQQKMNNPFGPDENSIEQCFAANIVQYCQKYWASCWARISLHSGVTMLNNIVDNLEQCGQQNIVQCCFYHARTACSFFAV